MTDALRSKRTQSAATLLNVLEYQLFLEVASTEDLEMDFISDRTLADINSRLKAKNMPCLKFRFRGRDARGCLFELERRELHPSEEELSVRAECDSKYDFKYAERSKLFIKAFS